MKIKILFILLCCFFTTQAFAQKVLRGQVINAQTGLPVSAATVKVIGGNDLAITTPGGEFRLVVKVLPDSIMITNIGFEAQRVALANVPDHQNIIIALKPATTTLQEVIVSTGYQTIPKERSTGSFTVVGNSKLNEQVSTDILSRLESVTSGLTFNRTTGETPQIQVRGLSTIKGPTSPLIVVDNFPYEGDISNINPNDVESITVLKDAAAASIWGTRAGNGVIVITTKRSRFNQPLSVDFNANLSIAQKPDLSYIKNISSGDYIDNERYLFNNGFYDDRINDPSHPGLTPAVELLLAARNGSITPAAADAGIAALRSLDVKDDFKKYFYRKSANQQYAIALKSGTDNQSWLFSGGYDKNISNLAAKYDRINFRFQNSFRPVSKLLIGTSLYYTQTNSSGGRPGYGSVQSYNNSLYPYAQFADLNGNAVPVAKDHSLSFLSTLPEGKLLDWKYYPLDDYKQGFNKTNLQDIVGNLSARYQLFKFLDAQLQYQYERQNTAINNLQGSGSYGARNLINDFTQIDGGGNVINIVPLGGILDQSGQLIESHNLRGQLNFNKSWGKHQIDALIGSELRQIKTTGNANAFYGYDPNTLIFGNVDLTTPYPNFLTGSTDFIQDRKSLTAFNNRFVSTFANAAYTYNGKYIFSVSGRRDASNLFGVNTNNKWNPLGSAGVAWDISKEGFYKLSFLPYLKLRATYGLSGNVNLNQTAVTTISYQGNSPYTQTPYAVYNTYGNPNLKWETTAMLNLGIDFGIVNDRINGSIEYFHKKGNNLFGNAPQDYTAGVGSTVEKNSASMKGNGFDLSISSKNIDGKFKWTSMLNVSFYQDQVTAYYLDNVSAYNFVGTTPRISGLIGKPVYAVFSYANAGLNPQNGNPRGYVDGQVSEDYVTISNNKNIADLKYNGSALPTKYGSFANTFSFKNLALTVVATYKLGYYFKKQSISYSSLLTNGIGNADYAMRWQKAGDENSTNVPSFTYPADGARDDFYLGSESLVRKGDHVRLQYITASYNLSRQAIPKLPFKNLQLYLNASNIGILWSANKDHIDPDYYYGYSSLKPPLTIAFGLKGTL